ncbi:hypothetical protein AAFC00_003865 [Neodothiora populina]|uniref:Uncharacterized protein n=1 Tax=Neodothiora populina TaxID=2781224 RepID=A0ABR3PFW0_9PEZI
MPKNPLKGFARRKSSGNVLDLQAEQPATPAGSSFRVLERPHAVERRTSAQRPMSAMPFGQKGKSTEDLRHLGTNTNRGSGTTTLSGSSGYYDTSSSSARYSSTSTLPSSFDQENETTADDLFPAKTSHQVSRSEVQAAHGAIPHPPSFSARASKAMSFGMKKKQSSPPMMEEEVIETVPALPDNAAIRDRATTVSSYASTAVPPRLEASLGASDFSSDFGNMFEGLGDPKKESLPLPPPPRVHGSFMRSDSEPLYAARTSSRPINTPSPEPEPQRITRPSTLTHTKRYSWQSRTSNDGLMSPGLDTDMTSPRSSEFSQDTIKPQTGFGRFRPGYQPVPLRYASPGFEGDSLPNTPGFPPHVGTASSDDDASQEDEARPMARMEPKVLNSSMGLPPRPQYDQRTNGYAQHPALAIVKNGNGPTNTGDDDTTGKDSQTTTPRAASVQPHVEDEAIFPASPRGTPSLTVHPASQRRPGPGAAHSPQKKMTRAQFEKQRAAPEDEESESSEESDDGYDDGDEEERQAEMIRQRRKQEANLAVYRQQMMKESGSQHTDMLQRPGFDRASLSAPSLSQGMVGPSVGGPEEEDDDVPLGILQAHGFPNKNRPPTRTGGSGSAPPTPGSVMGDGAGGALPPFARRLPPDPYFGASLVNPANRETLAFGGNVGGGSVYGGSNAPAVQPPPPGGLVGVIAGEERARAARRGSPNPATGGYGPIPLPGNMMNMPPAMPRSNSMMNVMPPQMGGMMPGMPMGMPGMAPMGMDTQQQMVQMMAMQQQMMQSIIQMQAGQMHAGQPPNFSPSPSMQSLGNGFLNPGGMPRPMSTPANAPGTPNAGRSMSMLQPPPQWGGDGNAHGRSNTMGSNAPPLGYAGSVYNFNLSAPAPGYTPSIAPSERSNVGMPSRYRPVSTMEANVGNGRSHTMTSGMDAVRQGAISPSPLAAAPQAPKSTIRVIDKPKGTPRSPPSRHSADDEDDDAAWAELRKKREARKTKKGTMTSKTPEPALSELYTTME